MPAEGNEGGSKGVINEYSIVSQYPGKFLTSYMYAAAPVMRKFPNPVTRHWSTPQPVKGIFGDATRV